MILRGPLELVKKELAANRRVALAVAGAVIAQYLLVMQFITRDEAPTLLRAATGFAWGAGPLLAAFTARRLFVLEQEQGTVHLLRALPVSPTLLVLTKFALGLALNLAINVGLLWATAALRMNAELFTFDWLVRLSAQISAYVFAWFAIACLMAQLGGYRYAVWLLLVFALIGLDDVVYEPQRNLFWTAPLADDLETTRYRTPWDAVGLGLAWGAAALAATLGIARHRGGSLVDAWFVPMSAKRAAQVTGAVFFGLVALELVGESSQQRVGLLESPREGHFVVAAAQLEPVAQGASAALARLADVYGLSHVPKALLRLRHDDRPEVVLTDWAGDDGLVIGLRADAAPEELAREVVVDVLMGRSGGLFELVPEAGIWSVGLGAALFEDPGLEVTASRLRDLDPALLEDYDAVLVRAGRRGAQAAGWMAWRAAEELGGAGAVRALAQALFGEARGRTGGGLVAAQSVSPRAVLAAHGVTWDALCARWRALAQALPRHPELELDLPPVALESFSDAAPHLVFEPPAAELAGRLELWWSAARDLDPHPVPHGVRYGSRELDGPQAALLDPRGRVVVTWVLDREVMGWREVVRR